MAWTGLEPKLCVGMRQKAPPSGGDDYDNLPLALMLVLLCMLMLKLMLLPMLMVMVLL